jgi:hypothetical protein
MGTTSTGGQISLLGQSGRVVVVGNEPLLEAILNPDGTRGMAIYSPPASVYAVEYTTNLADSSSWVRLFEGASMTLSTSVSGLDPSFDRVFYRAVRSSN